MVQQEFMDKIAKALNLKDKYETEVEILMPEKQKLTESKVEVRLTKSLH